MSDSIEARVARGAAWLDENHPGWERRIDLADLQLSSSCRCVLGQLFGDFHDAPVSLEPYTEPFGNWAQACGFTCGAWSEHVVLQDEFKMLDEAWIALLKERFDSGLLSDEPRP